MNTILSKPVFSLGERTFTWLDVVLAAIVRGDWAALETQVSLGLALVERADETDQLPAEADIDAAAEEFRYERDLVTAEEMEAWLERCGLTLDEWMEYIERLVVRQADPDPDDDSVLESFDAEAVGANVITEAICSGELYRFAQTLAGRAAIASRAADAETLDRDAIDRAVERALRLVERSGLGLDAGVCLDTIREIARLEQLFERVSRGIVTDEAIRAQVEAHRLDWIRLEVRDLGFSEEAAAKEAALCLREDGASLESVAADAHSPVRDGKYYLDEADPEARPLLLSARPDELVGPLAFPDGFHLMLVRGKIMPNDQDSEIRRRAEETLLARLSEQEAETRVQWHQRM